MGINNSMEYREKPARKNSCSQTCPLSAPDSPLTRGVRGVFHGYVVRTLKTMEESLKAERLLIKIDGFKEWLLQQIQS